MRTPLIRLATRLSNVLTVAAVGVGLPVMTDCFNVTELCDSGDELEIDFRSGMFFNHTRDIRKEYPPLPEALQEIVALGGNTGWLKRWWQEKQAAQA